MNTRIYWAVAALCASACATSPRRSEVDAEDSEDAEPAVEGAAPEAGGARVVSTRPPIPDVRHQAGGPAPLELERAKLANGVEIVVAPRDGSPVTSVAVMFLGGSSLI